MKINVFKYDADLHNYIDNEKKFYEISCSDLRIKAKGTFEFETITGSGEVIIKHFIYNDRFLQRIKGYNLTKADITGFLPSSEELVSLAMRMKNGVWIEIK